MMLPTAPGVLVCFGKSVEVDHSNSGDGYITVRYTGGQSGKCLIKLMCGNLGQTFKLFGDSPKVIPLCFGSGEYSLYAGEEPDGRAVLFIPLLSCKIPVDLRDPLSPYLYPNVYCDYTGSSLCVQAANKACADIAGDTRRFGAIYRWVMDNIVYDCGPAEQLAEGKGPPWWIPGPDTAIVGGKATCWGYASLFAGMCRPMGIPCRICVGNVGGDKNLRAWNEVYLRSAGKAGKLKVPPGTWLRVDATYLGGKNDSGVLAICAGGGDRNVKYYG